MSYKFDIEKIHIVKKDPSSFTLIKTLGLNITLTEKLSKSKKVIVETIIYNRKLNENYSARARLHENLNPLFHNVEKWPNIL